MKKEQGGVRALLLEVTGAFEAQKEYLSGLDAQVGDGDHGFSMARGCGAGRRAVEDLPEDSAPGEYLKAYGRALTCEVGGAMGPLFGLIFTQLGAAVRASGRLDTATAAKGMEDALGNITELGGAREGDKTMVDAIAPAVRSLADSAEKGLPLAQALADSARAARGGLEATEAMAARRGRAKYLREKSVGHRDAGAASFCLLMDTMRRWAEEEGQ